MDHHAADSTRGRHTLRVFRGTIVDVRDPDVFVDLGPRRQGVIHVDAFEEPPRRDQEFNFTLRGREDELWALALEDERSLVAWKEMEVGSLVAGRVLRATPDGLQLKIGPLHAFMPKSQSGVPRGHKITELVGRTLAVEVLEVDDDKQRVIVSHKAIVKRQRAGEAGGVVPGALVHGRVTRVEDYGVFVRFGRGREGLAHVSNLAADRPDHPAELFKVGDAIDALVLTVRASGKRIGLGVKQLQENPWKRAEREVYPGQLVEVDVTRVKEFGAFARLFPGVEGLIPASETPGGDLRRHLAEGRRVTVRVLRVDADAERATFSMLHEGGAIVLSGAAADQAAFEERKAELDPGRVGTSLGDLLRAALDGNGGAARKRTA